MSKIYQETRTKTTPSSPRQPRPRTRAPAAHPAAIIQRARAAPESLSAADVLQLQRTIGNRAVGRLLAEIGSRQVPLQRQEVPEDGECLQCTRTVQRQGRGEGFRLDDETAGRINRNKTSYHQPCSTIQRNCGNYQNHTMPVAPITFTEFFLMKDMRNTADEIYKYRADQKAGVDQGQGLNFPINTQSWLLEHSEFVIRQWLEGREGEEKEEEEGYGMIRHPLLL